MSIKFIDIDIFDIYVSKSKIEDLDLANKNILEDYLKNLFKKLKSKYSIDIVGFYDVNIYIDKYYGVVIHMEKEKLEYYSYYKNEVDMKISIIDNKFLYQINDIPHNLLNKIKIHIIDNNMYLELISNIKETEMMYLIEHTNYILYDYCEQIT